MLCDLSSELHAVAFIPLIAFKLVGVLLEHHIWVFLAQRRPKLSHAPHSRDAHQWLRLEPSVQLLVPLQSSCFVFLYQWAYFRRYKVWFLLWHFLFIRAETVCSLCSGGPEGNRAAGKIWATNFSPPFCNVYLVHLSCKFLKACLPKWAQADSDLLDRKEP